MRYASTTSVIVPVLRLSRRRQRDPMKVQWSSSKPLFMLDDLLTEQSFPGSPQLDTLPTPMILGIINAADAEIAGAVAREIPRIALAVEAVTRALECGGHLYY